MLKIPKEIIHLIKKLIEPVLLSWPIRNMIRVIQTNNGFTFKIFFMQKILGFNRRAYWPTHFTSVIAYPERVFVGLDGTPGLSPGCYIQGMGKIYFGDYVIIGPNVGIISGNHNVYDIRNHDLNSVRIGNYCWIGMNSIILPGVELGDHTVVAANTVVTKSFTDGYCILAGNPAKIIKQIDKNLCVDFEYQPKYYGYIPAARFERYKEKNLAI